MSILSIVIGVIALLLFLLALIIIAIANAHCEAAHDDFRFPKPEDKGELK